MVAVVKIGGSVLTGIDAYRRAAAALAAGIANDGGRSRLVVVVSAELGTTDRDFALARSFSADPDPRALDLLWSTGEQRSVALLTLALQAAGADAVGLNVHEIGLRTGRPGSHALDRAFDFNPLRLKAALSEHAVVVVPGFLARGAGDRVVSLGRGGSDLTAVLLAIALGAERCELVKDVPGYFTEDPAVDPDARRLPALTYADALEKELGGCGLVQRAAIEAAARAGVPLVIRSLDPVEGHTLLSASEKEEEAIDEICDANDSLGTAVGA